MNDQEELWERVVAEIRAQGRGNCYEAAYTLIRNAAALGWENVRLVHAIVTGNGGDAEGHDFGHAWVEHDLIFGDVYRVRLAADYSSGKSTDLPVEYFREVGKAREIREYTVEEALLAATRNRHFGPWDAAIAKAEHVGKIARKQRN